MSTTKTSFNESVTIFADNRDLLGHLLEFLPINDLIKFGCISKTISWDFVLSHLRRLRRRLPSYDGRIFSFLQENIKKLPNLDTIEWSQFEYGAELASFATEVAPQLRNVIDLDIQFGDFDDFEFGEDSGKAFYERLDKSRLRGLSNGSIIAESFDWGSLHALTHAYLFMSDLNEVTEWVERLSKNSRLQYLTIQVITIDDRVDCTDLNSRLRMLAGQAPELQSITFKDDLKGYFSLASSLLCNDAVPSALLAKGADFFTSHMKKTTGLRLNQLHFDTKSIWDVFYTHPSVHTGIADSFEGVSTMGALFDACHPTIYAKLDSLCRFVTFLSAPDMQKPLYESPVVQWLESTILALTEQEKLFRFFDCEFISVALNVYGFLCLARHDEADARERYRRQLCSILNQAASVESINQALDQSFSHRPAKTWLRFPAAEAVARLAPEFWIDESSNTFRWKLDCLDILLPSLTIQPGFNGQMRLAWEPTTLVCEEALGHLCGKSYFDHKKWNNLIEVIVKVMEVCVSNGGKFKAPCHEFAQWLILQDLRACKLFGALIPSCQWLRQSFRGSRTSMFFASKSYFDALWEIENEFMKRSSRKEFDECANIICERTWDNLIEYIPFYVPSASPDDKQWITALQRLHPYGSIPDTVVKFLQNNGKPLLDDPQKTIRERFRDLLASVGFDWNR